MATRACQRGSAPNRMCPPSSWEMGRRLSIVTNTPAIVLHPVAFAGWLGVFVTMLNLLPISQLDGGHILFGALPRWHARVAIGFWALIVALGVYWRGWLLWGALVLVLSRGRLGHPPVLDGQRPLPRSRTLLAWIGLILFLVTFTPIPFRL